MANDDATKNADDLFVVPKSPQVASLTRPVAPAHGVQTIAASPSNPDETATRESDTDAVAILVCHGMGQQVPFETIDGVARLLRRATLGPPPAITTQMVRTGSSYLAQAALSLSHEGRSRDVHIYEASWAPLTAGQVSLKDVVAFLLRAAADGLIRNNPLRFRRLMFGSWQNFRIRLRAFGLLALVAATFLALAWISIVIVAVTAARSILHGPSTWPSSAMVNALTQDMLPFLASAGSLVILYTWALARERRRDQSTGPLAPRRAPHLVNGVIWFALILTIAMSLAASALMLLDLVGVGDVTEWLRDLPAVAVIFAWLRSHQFSATAITIIWTLVIGINFYIRSVLVDYLGDVAAYIAAHTVSKFEQIRVAIQQRAKSAAQEILGMKDASGKYIYARVIMLGHSLGSVIAYDTTNALLLDEALGIEPLHKVQSRLTHLITFGSPLDKTAFLFREQQPRNSQVRESLATNVQPLILDRRFRSALRWENLWSPADLISGHLSYYDEDADHAALSGPPAEHRVNNAKDPHSTIPLLAHIMYWQSPLLANKLLLAVVR